jgi:hypothetical protein
MSEKSQKLIEKLNEVTTLLKTKLQKKNMVLDTSVQYLIDIKLKQLQDNIDSKADEFDYKTTSLQRRVNNLIDKLQKVYQQLDITPIQQRLHNKDIDNLVNEYNQAMNSVSKNEGVQLKVIDSMGRTNIQRGGSQLKVIDSMGKVVFEGEQLKVIDSMGRVHYINMNDGEQLKIIDSMGRIQYTNKNEGQQLKVIDSMGRTNYTNKYEEKYLKYKQKYLELKNQS